VNTHCANSDVMLIRCW